MASKLKTKMVGRLADGLILAFLTLLFILIVFPFYQVLMVSLTTYQEIQKYPVFLFPTEFTLDSYKYVFGYKEIRSGFLVSAFTTVAGTLLSILMSTAAAFALSRKYLPGRKILIVYIMITMLFSGGLVPYYVTIVGLKLQNTLAVLILPMAVNAFYLFIMISFFRMLPASLEESARIDGANELYILVKVFIPISTPILATMALYYAVDKWNEWYTAVLFISDRDKLPLQNILREVLTNFQMMVGGAGKTIAASKRPVFQKGVQMAALFITALPVLVLYPFLQRYFIKGLIIGSVKE